MSLLHIVRRIRRVGQLVRRKARHSGRETIGFVNFHQRHLVFFLILIATLSITIWWFVDSWNWLASDFWTWLRNEPDGAESGSTTLRNLGLLAAAAIALPLAILAQLGRTVPSRHRAAKSIERTV